MITTTCWILWIPTCGGVGVEVEDWVGPPHATATTSIHIASATRLTRPTYPSRPRRTIGETSGLCKPLRARVDIEAIAAKESDQGLVEFPRQRHSQAGWRADGGQQWNARPDRLLDDLEIASATRLTRPTYPSRPRRTIGETSGLCKPLRARVDIEAIAAKESDQGLVEFPRQRHSQAGWRADGGQQWNARPDRLLDDL